MKKSYWSEVSPSRYFPLAKSERFDVVIVGGGITGLCAAYFLKKAGKKVCVLERDRITSGDTCHTTAHLTYVTDSRLTKLIRTFGEDAAQLAWQGGEVAIRALEQITKDLKIRCQFARVPGYLHLPLQKENDEQSDHDEMEDLKEEADLARRLGFDATFKENITGVHRPGIEFPNQARFHPISFLSALAKAIDSDGSVIHEHAEVTEVSDDPLAVICGNFCIECDYLVIATHVPLMGKAGYVGATYLQTRLAPYSSYAIGAQIPKGLFPDALFCDTSDPYYYLRLHRGTRYDYAIFGGEDHKTGQVSDTAERYQWLEKLLKQLLPDARVDHRWSGQVIETVDGLPLIGETSPRQFAATGFAGNGMTFGCLSGLMACDAAFGRKNPWQELFATTRTNLRGGTWEFVRENVDYPYYMIADRLTRDEVASPEEIGIGEGKVLTIDGKRVACSRDAGGKVTEVSAICTHMGCVVHWNNAEATWDCPCHGSRFEPTGEVISGPAETPLESVATEDAKSDKEHAHSE